MTTERKSTKLRGMLEEPGILVVPGAFDALSARVAELVGFRAVFHTGYGTAASLLAAPDIGLISFGEMVARVASIARAVNIPVLADADTGYGNPINAYRTVKEYIWAGAAGLFIEDQVWPKRCGHMFGKMVIDMEEMVGKIMAAVDARREEDPDFVVGARTDALAVADIEEAIERANQYRKAGADFIFIEGFEDLDQMKRAVKEVKAPLMLNLVEGGRTPLVTVQEAERLGFKLVVFPVTALYAATKAMIDALRSLRETGDPRIHVNRILTFKEFAAVVKLEQYAEMEQKYIPEGVLERMYGRGPRRPI